MNENVESPENDYDENLETPENDSDDTPEDGVAADDDENVSDDSCDMDEEWDNDYKRFENINEQFMATAKQGYMAKDKGFIKAIRNFYKRLKNTLANRNTLSNNLVTFGQQTDDSVVPGRKRRHTNMIHVQPTARSRRKHKHGGKGASTKGRRPKGTETFVADEAEFQPKPTKKRKSARKVHSLKAAVDANLSAVRKH